MKKLKKFLKKIELEERLSIAEILEAESAKPKHITQKMQSLYAPREMLLLRYQKSPKCYQ